jgi:hypothetical protein
VSGVAAARATEHVATDARSGVDASTGRALLAGTHRWYLQSFRTVPDALVAEHRHRHAPTDRQDGAVQSGLLRHVDTGVFDAPGGRCSHVFNTQVFDHDQAVVFRQMRRCLVQRVTSPPCLLCLCLASARTALHRLCDPRLRREIALCRRRSCNFCCSVGSGTCGVVPSDTIMGTATPRSMPTESPNRVIGSAISTSHKKDTCQIPAW